MKGSFRVTGFTPELWHADSASTEAAAYRMAGDRTIVPLKLYPHEAVFVMFLKRTRQREREVAEPFRQVLGRVSGPWIVHFQPGRGAPNEATFAELTSWTLNADTGIKYFSGTAKYETTLNVPASWRKQGGRIELDLGEVKNLAEVLINGTSAGILWKAPFRVDVTDLLHSGSNRLSVRVTNLWANRLIGDKQPGVTPVASTTFNPYRADSPLLGSGLLGPVSILGLQPTGAIE
jgi:hypothetical protein